MSSSFFLCACALSSFLSVGLGAFGAHALKGRFDEYQMGVFQTGVEYQFYHSLALGIVAIAMRNLSSASFKISGLFFLCGIILFSGSLYLLAATRWKMLGAITPFGGVCFLTGWLVLFFAAIKSQ